MNSLYRFSAFTSKMSCFSTIEATIITTLRTVSCPVIATAVEARTILSVTRRWTISIATSTTTREFDQQIGAAQCMTIHLLQCVLGVAFVFKSLRQNERTFKMVVKHMHMWRNLTKKAKPFLTSTRRSLPKREKASFRSRSVLEPIVPTVMKKKTYIHSEEQLVYL
jgi:hypothetical protein